MSKSRLIELEKRVDLALKGMNLLLFGEAESISKKEKNELRRRLNQYVMGKGSEFAELKDVQGSLTQESD